MMMESQLEKRTFMPLPPGMVPSDSRENMADVLQEENKQQCHQMKAVVITPSKSTTDGTETIHNNIKPSCPPVEGWTPTVEKQISSLAINSQTPTYHIDLSTEVGEDSEPGVAKVKVSGPTWQPLSPLKRFNKVIPTPLRKKEKHQEMNTLQSNSESSFTIGKENRGPKNRLGETDHDRPGSAPLQNRGHQITGIITSDEGIEGLVEIHHPFEDPPAYSRVVKIKPTTNSITPLYSSDSEDDITYTKVQPKDIDSHVTSLVPELPPTFGCEEKERYIQELISVNPDLSPSVNNIRSSSSLSANVIQVFQNRAESSNDTDSLYTSLHEEDTNKHTYSEIPEVDPKYYDALKKHKGTGNVQLISIRGMISNPEIKQNCLDQKDSSDMHTIHYVSAMGHKKDLEGILSLLPIIQDPVEMVLGSNKFCRREGVDVKDGEGRTALMHAVHHGHTECVKLLAEAGANVNIETSDGSTCLHEAAYSSTPQMMALLLSLGADGLKKDNEGRVALHWATYNDDPECINLLLDKVPGQSVNIQDGAKMTPLMWAAFHGKPINIETLRKRGADSQLKDKDGMRAIHWSIKSMNTRALQVLLSPESSEYRDDKGKTVMHIAAEQGFAKAIEMIKSTRPLSVNDQDNNRRSPLHWATVCEKPEALRALTAAGADPALYDAMGCTALDYALKRGLHYCGLLLAQAIEEQHDREAAIGYHHVLRLGQGTSIGARTLLQQEGKVFSEEINLDQLTEEHILHIKAVCTGTWINKFTNDGKGPLHQRFFWVNPLSMTICWSKTIESRYVSNKEMKSDVLVGVRSSASSSILQRKDFDPLNKHKFTFTIFTNNRVLDMVAMSSEDFKTWLNGLQLVLHLGSEAATKVYTE